MSDDLRRAQVYALWHSQLDWLVGVNVQQLDVRKMGEKAGFTDGRRTTCERCRGTGRVQGEGVSARPCGACVTARFRALETGGDWRPSPLHGCRRCLLCDGEGMRLTYRGELGEDEYRKPAKTGLLDAANRRADERAARDREIDRLDRTLRLDAGQEDADWWLSRAVRVKESLYRRGHYAELDGHMRVLKVVNPLAHTIVTRVEVNHEPILVSDSTRRLIDNAADWVADRMPTPIRVPHEHEPSERRAAAKDSLWRGKTERHAQQRELRRQRVLKAHLEWGWSTAEIAAHESLSERRVRQLIAEDARDQEPAA